jgi:hypothetical protein
MSSGNFGHAGRPGLVGGSLSNHRNSPIPAAVSIPISLSKTDATIKAHPSYKAAKAGSIQDAGKLLRDLAFQFIVDTGKKFDRSSIFISPHAIEASGENAIPQALAECMAVITGGMSDKSIVQQERVYHTGADPMERIISRPHFDGTVLSGGKYVLVDDVSTMGTTLAELANFIQKKGGVVVGAVLLVNASRAEKLSPTKKAVTELEKRHGNGIEEIFGIQPKALTADEATYLLGFRTTDAIRNRVAAAREATNLRLHSKGIRRPGATSTASKPLILFFKKKKDAGL